MTEKSRNEVNDIVVSLSDRELAKEVDAVRMIDPITSLRNTIFDSFKKRLEIIFDDEDIKTAAMDKLKEKISNDELTVPQLMSLVNSSRQNSTVAMDSLLSVLKPVPNATSPLFSNMDKEREENIISAFDGVSGTEGEAISKLIRLMGKLSDD